MNVINPLRACTEDTELKTPFLIAAMAAMMGVSLYAQAPAPGTPGTTTTTTTTTTTVTTKTGQQQTQQKNGDEPNGYRAYEIGWNLLSYSRQGQADLYGGDLSFSVHITPRIGIVADAAVHSTIDTTPTINTYTYRFGPKFVARYGRRITTFGEVLVGGARIKGTLGGSLGSTTVSASESFNGVAFAVGGGVDIGIRPWIAFRAAQFDYSLLRFNSIDTTSSGLRVGLGLVFRFGM